MELTVLGADGTYPAPGGACTGFLLTHEGYRMWLDAGHGTFARLQQHVDGVDAVFLSHAHADHVVDLYPFFYSRMFSDAPPLPIFAPAGTRQRLESFVGETVEQFRTVFQWRELEVGDRFDAGPFSVETFGSVHSRVNLTTRIAAEGRILCYSGDTGPNDALIDAARDADVFLCESSWLESDRGMMDPIHMTASDAGTAAAKADVDRLLLTHLWPRNDRDVAREQASSTFDGALALAVQTPVTTV